MEKAQTNDGGDVKTNDDEYEYESTFFHAHGHV
jgi:hypothetical protein